MTQLRTADAEWVRSALARYESPLLRFASRLLGDPEGARDVVQDTFMRLCREDPTRLDGHLAQWLFTVCRNRVLDVLRREGRLQPLDGTLDECPSPVPSPALQLEERDHINAVMKVLVTLPPAQQEVLRMKFGDGLSYREISAATGRTVNHVGVLIHNGLKALRIRLGSTYREPNQGGPDARP